MLPSESSITPTPVVTSLPTTSNPTSSLEKLMQYFRNYKDLVEKEKQGLDVESQIIRVLINIIEEVKEIEDTLKLLPQTPSVIQRIHKIQKLKKIYEKELFERRFPIKRQSQ